MLWFKIAVVVFATIPVLNKYGFKVVNLEELKLDIKDHLVVINEAVNDGEYEDARNSCREFEAQFGTNTDEFSRTGMQTVLMLMGNTYQAEWNFEKAIETFKRLEKEYPQSPFAELTLVAIANNYFSLAPTLGEERPTKKAFKDAITYFDKVVRNREKTKEFPQYQKAEITPGKIPISETVYLEDQLIGIGRCYLRMRQPEKAREMFQLVVDFFPGSDAQDDAQKFIGDSYLRQGSALTKQAETADGQEKDNLLYDADKLNKSALRTYQDFANKYGQSEFKSDVLINMGEVYFRMGQQEKAVATFTEAVNAIKLPEEQAKVQIKIGNYYFNTEQYDKSIETYEKVIKNFPDSKIAANAQYLMGEAYEKTGNVDKAFIAYDNICEFYKTSPFYAPAAFKLGSKMMDKKDFKGALGYFRKGILLYKRSNVADQTQFMIGIAYMNLSDYRQAIKEFEYVLGEYPDSKWVEKAHYQIGICYNNLDDKDAARDAFASISSDRELMVAGMAAMGVDANNPDEQIRTWEEKLADEEQPEAKAMAYIELGKVYMEGKKDYPMALESFTNADGLTEDAIKKINIKSMIAGTYFLMDEFDKSRQLYTEILTTEKVGDEMKIQAEFKIYDAYRKEGDYEKALEGFTSFVASHEDHSLAGFAQFLMGMCYNEMKQYDNAVTEYQKVIDNYSDSDVMDDAGLAIGTAYKTDGQLDLAIDAWEKFMEEHPGCDAASQIYYQLGDAYREHRKDLPKAIEYYARVYESDDGSALYSAAAYQAGMAYLAQKDTDMARSTLELVKKEDRQFYQAARAEIGKIMALVDPAQAITEYEEIEGTAVNDEDRTMARLGIGDIHAARKKFKAAAESYLMVIEQYPDIPEDLMAGAYIKLIDAYNNTRQFRNVITYSDQMIDKYPENEFTINAVYFKANAYYSLKKYKTAMNVFQEVINQDKSPALTEIAKYQKAECLLFQNRSSEAIKAYSAFQKEYPKSAYYPLSVYQQGNAYWGKEQFKSALAKYKKVVDNFPDFSEVDMAMAFLGYCYDRTDNWRAAKKLYQRVLKRKKNKAAVKFAREQLEKLNVIH